MGRPMGSRKTKQIAVTGTIDLGSESLYWERQLLAQHFKQLLIKENSESLETPGTEPVNDHA